MQGDTAQKHSESTPRAKRGYGGLTADARDTLRREQLIAAGIDQFGTVGYPATTIESLCGAARVSTRDFYSYFATKEDLLLAAYNEIIAKTLHSVADAVADASDTPLDSARAGLEAFVNATVRDERWARINFIEIVGVSARVEARRREVIHNFADLIKSFAGPLVAQDMFDPEALTPIRGIAMVGAVHETLTDWVMRKERQPLDLVVSELTALFVAATRR